MAREGRVYCGQPKSRLSAPVPIRSRRRRREQSSACNGRKFNSHAERIDVIDRASSWISAPIRDGLSCPPLDCAAESRSLEESFRVVVPVASSFEAFALSGQSAHSLRLRGDRNRPSFSTSRLSEQYRWAYSYCTLLNAYCSFGS